MPELRNRKSKKVWYDRESFYRDAVALDPDLKAHSPQAVWDAYSKDPDYEVGGQVSASQPLPTTQEPPAAGFSPTNALFNLPGSFMKQAKQMGQGVLGALRQANPEALMDTGSLASKAVASGAPVKYLTDSASEAGSAIKKDYSDFYTSGKLLKNIEEDPARLLADVATVAGPLGWMAKAGGFGRVAKGVSMVGDAANMLSSPVAIPSKIAGKIPAASKAMSEKGMTYALKLPPETTIEAGERLRDFALKNKLDMGMTGRAKSKQGYKREVRNMSEMERNSTADIDKTDVQLSARKAVSKGNRATDDKLADAYASVDKAIEAPVNFGGQPIISPVKAADIRKRMNESAAPKRDTVRDVKSSLEAQGEQAVADAIREKLGEAIPGHRDTALRAMDFHDAYEAADRVQRGMRNSSLVDHMQTSSLGAPVSSVFKGHPFTPASIGAVGKFLHTPEKISKLAIKGYVQNPKAIEASIGQLRSPAARGMFNAAKQVEYTPATQEETPNQPSTGFKRY